MTAMNWTHHHATINGIRMHYVEQGRGMPVVLCHGFPHLWFSWHRQISALAAAGYRVIAPDMRGMGQTEAPAAVAAYDIDHITADLLGLLDHIGEPRAVFAGLDFGAFAIYDLALRHPQRVIAVIGLENPAAPHNPDEPPLAEYRRMGEQHFLHIEYFREPPRADRELAAAPRRFLHKVFHTLSGACNYFEMFRHPPGTSYIDAMEEPPPLPWSWLAELELEFFVSEYSRSGFTGGLNWYRSFDLKWAQRKPFEGVQSAVPAYFLGSEHDVDLEGFHGQDPIGQMRGIFPDLRQVRMIPGAGHMVQLEASVEVNAILLAYLEDIHRHARIGSTDRMETPETIVRFWFGDSDDDATVASNCAGLWWSKNPELDRRIRERFEPTVQAAAAGALNHWRASSEGWLALIILTDQFPRNMYRGAPDAFRYDPIARQLCEAGLAAAADQQLQPVQRAFFYLPLEHSENLADQVRSVALFSELAAGAPAGAQTAFDGFHDFARRHKAVIDRFGRFPHRNEILGRPSTEAEIAFLREPGSSF